MENIKTVTLSKVSIGSLLTAELVSICSFIRSTPHTKDTLNYSGLGLHFTCNSYFWFYQMYHNVDGAGFVMLYVPKLYQFILLK